MRDPSRIAKNKKQCASSVLRYRDYSSVPDGCIRIPALVQQLRDQLGTTILVRPYFRGGGTTLARMERNLMADAGIVPALEAHLALA